jgi:preprotein translocase subunit SecE
MLDKIKLLVAVLLIAAGITGFYTFAEEALLYRVLALLAVFIVAFVISLKTKVGLDTWNFGRSAVLEVRKSVWPTRQETIQATLMVMVMVVIMGLILWLFDMMLLSAVQLLTGQGG